ncbi:unnamed protein product [Hermetia illucens]|uniref:Uncharacterized protein n=1 Tax=Hermetia illucens TaxID=343691 RepID=A0A7R8V3G0_HERIL|nr:unnamed protein product [Hermetia illucens]
MPTLFKPSESSLSTDQPNIDEITTDIAHLANRLPDIALTTDDIDDLLCSHSQELTDKDLIQLEAQVQEEAIESQEIASSISNSEKELTRKKLFVAFANLENAMEILEEMILILREVLMLITKFVQPISVTKTCMIARRKMRSNLELIVSLSQKFNLQFLITYFDY